MSNYNSLKATIDANIKQNGNQEITGQILNSVLNAMVTTLGAEYQFAGVATTATNPGTPDAKVFYIANGKGTYTNFGGLEVTEDEVVVLYWDTAWHKEATGIASQAKLTELESRVGDLDTKYDEFQLSNRNGLVLRGDIVSTEGSSSTTEFSTSDFIAIPNGTIEIDYYNTFAEQPNNYFAGFVMYNEAKTEIVYVGGETGKVLLADYPTAKYFRFCCPPNVKLDDCRVRVTYDGKVLSNYVLEKEINKVNDKVNLLIQKQRHQLYERNGLVLRGDIVGVEGNSNTTGFSTSDFIKIPNSTIEIDYYNTFAVQPNNYFAGFVMYDEAKENIIYVGGETGNVNIKDYPTAKYFRFCCDAAVELNDCKVVVSILQGNDDLTDISKVTFVDTMGNTEGYISTQSDSIYIGYDKVFSQDGVLSEYVISLVGASQSDINVPYEFVLGHIDQRNWLLPRVTFTKNVSTIDEGNLIFDFSDEIISFKKNEVLFIKAKKTALSTNNDIVPVHSGTEKILFTEDLYNAVQVYGGGVEANIKITIKNITSYFASQEEQDSIKTDIDRIESSLTKKQDAILVDEANGDKYKITVNNGSIVLKLIKYTKVLFIGNSFTKHDFVSGLWESNGRSMAASTDSVMYASLVAEKLGLQADRANLRDDVGYFERLLLDYDLTYLPNKSESYDAIVVQLGENIIETDTNIVATAFRNLFVAIKANWGNADLYMMFGTWRSQSQAISNVASAMSIPIINCGNVSLATPYQAKDYYIGDNGQYYEMNDAVYRSHPSDVGMFNMAQKVVEAFGEVAISDKLFALTLNQTQGGTISTASDKWVEGGVVTIRCVADAGKSISGMSVIANGESVVATKRVGTYVTYTFIMPKGNVTITPTWGVV